MRYMDHVTLNADQVWMNSCWTVALWRWGEWQAVNIHTSWHTYRWTVIDTPGITTQVCQVGETPGCGDRCDSDTGKWHFVSHLHLGVSGHCFPVMPGFTGIDVQINTRSSCQLFTCQLSTKTRFKSRSSWSNESLFSLSDCSPFSLSATVCLYVYI